MAHPQSDDGSQRGRIPQTASDTQGKEIEMSNDGSSTLLAFLLGAVTGGVAALLLAPTSGRELRQKMGEGAEKARATALESARQASQKVTEKYEETTERARELVTGAKEGAEFRGKAVKEAFKEGKAAYERELGKS